MPRLIALILVLAAFTSYSMWVTLERGYWGFLTLALNDPWGMQLLLDLSIALGIAWVGLRRDAAREGIPTWPYLVATLFLGSMAPLTYLVHRQVRKLRRPAGAAVSGS